VWKYPAGIFLFWQAMRGIYHAQILSLTAAVDTPGGSEQASCLYSHKQKYAGHSRTLMGVDIFFG